MPNRQIPSIRLFFPSEDIAHILKDVREILLSGRLTLGKYTEQFEHECAKICGTKHAVAVNSGTSALEVTLRAFELKNGDEILVPTNTFSATASAVLFAGGKPKLIDIDAETLCVNAQNVLKNITSKTRGVIVVHIGGLVCPDIKSVRELCEDHHLWLIEDAAHAHGSSIDGNVAGSLGDVGCFSFYPTKVITTGEGGMITTNNEKIATKARILRDQGKKSFHSSLIVELGYNWRLTEIGAAIGITQVKRLPEIIERRNEIAQLYDEKLRRIAEIAPRKTPLNVVNNYYKYVSFLDASVNREGFKQSLRERGVFCGGEVYWPPLHLQPVYQRLMGSKRGDFPITEDVCKKMVCLPMYTQMSNEDVVYVTDNLEKTLSGI